MAKKYRIAETYAEQIGSGHLRPGTQLPSDRELAAHWGVARGTIREAVKLLVDAGAVTVIHGVGSFVIGPPASALKLDIEVPFGPDEKLTVALAVITTNSTPAVQQHYRALLHRLGARFHEAVAAELDHGTAP